MQKVFVTGASGFVGRHVVRELLMRNVIVVASYYHEPLAEWQQAVKQDYLIPIKLVYGQQLEIDLKGIIAIINCAAYGVDWRDNQNEIKAIKTNIEGPFELFKFSERARVKHFVHVGSCYEYEGVSASKILETHKSHPSSIYARTKLKATQMFQSLALNSETKITITRLFGIWGPGEYASRLVPQIVKACLTKTPVPLTAGEQIYDYTYVKDMANWLVRIALDEPHNSGEIINLGSGRPQKLREFAESIAVELGGSEFLCFGQLPYRQKEIMVLVADNNRMIGRLGHIETTSIRNGLKDVLQELSINYNERI